MLKPDEGSTPLALLIGEFKTVEVVEEGRRVWIRHMPDAPLLIEDRVPLTGQALSACSLLLNSHAQNRVVGLFRRGGLSTGLAGRVVRQD